MQQYADNSGDLDLRVLTGTPGYRIQVRNETEPTGQQWLVLPGWLDSLVEAIGTVVDNLRNFLSLSDTPASYTGQAGKTVIVKATEDGLEFGTAAGGSGEANTASNVGAGGVGPFKQKTGDDLEFKNINAGSSKITITDDAANSEIDVDVAESNIVHQNINGAGANTHTQIDTHIANTANPHSTTKTHVSLGNVTDDAQLKRASGDIATFGEKGSPVSADLVLIEDSEDSNNKKRVQVGNLPGGGGGETNTASNVGTAGVGPFKQKNGVDLEFKNINAGSNKISITDDAVEDEIDVDVNEANIVHQNIDGAGTNTHATIDSHISSSSNPHSVTKAQVSLTNVTDDAQLKRAAGDIATFGAKASPVSADLLLIEDSEDSNNKKSVQVGNLPGGGSSTVRDSYLFSIYDYPMTVGNLNETHGTQFLCLKACNIVGVNYKNAIPGSNTFRFRLWRVSDTTTVAGPKDAVLSGEGPHEVLFDSPYAVSGSEIGTLFIVTVYETSGSNYTYYNGPSQPAVDMSAVFGRCYMVFERAQRWANTDVFPSSASSSEVYTIDPIIEYTG